MKNMKHLARCIIHEHTEATMNSVEFHPDNDRELYDYMVEGCAFIISEKFIDGELTPMEYNDLRNEVADILWKIFAPLLKDEM